MEVKYWAITISKILKILTTEKILRNLKRIDFLLTANDIFKSGKLLLNYNLLNHFLPSQCLGQNQVCIHRLLNHTI